MKISIIIPCRNEEKYIGQVLKSVVNQDYPQDKLEVLIVDGRSEDGTRNTVDRYVRQYPFIRLLDNPKKITPCALNIGIKNAMGEVIMRMDAHAIYQKDYISKCLKYLKKHNVDNVGGIVATLYGNDTVTARAIALAISHPFGVGNSHFRIGSKKPKYVDTVPFGCYKKEIFEKIGLFDEDLVRNQDDEFNLRLIKNGGKILLVPEIVSSYYARESLSKIWNMYFQYGYFKPLVAKKLGSVLTLRQIIPSFFICSVIISALISFIIKPFLWFVPLFLSLYLIVNLFFSFSISLKNNLRVLPYLPVTFAVLHFSYGIGYLKGIFDFLILKKYKKRKIEVPLTR